MTTSQQALARYVEDNPFEPIDEEDFVNGFDSGHTVGRESVIPALNKVLEYIGPKDELEYGHIDVGDVVKLVKKALRVANGTASR